MRAKCSSSPNPSVSPRLGALFSEFARSLDTMYADYTDDQRETILDFVGESVRRLEQAAARLPGSSALGGD